jgi:hypothetical protein
LPSAPASGGTNFGEEAKEHNVREEEKEGGSAQINNLIELRFLKIFYLCMTWSKYEVRVLVGIII